MSVWCSTHRRQSRACVVCRHIAARIRNAADPDALPGWHEITGEALPVAVCNECSMRVASGEDLREVIDGAVMICTECWTEAAKRAAAANPLSPE